MTVDPSIIRNALNNSKIQQDNPPLYQCISALIDKVQELVKPETIDWGSGFTNAADANGTVINFNVNFSTVNVLAIVLAINGNSNIGYCTIITKNNTFFTVMAFDTTGARMNAVIDWVAYGIEN